MMISSLCIFIFSTTIALFSCSVSVRSQQAFEYPKANPPTKWTNSIALSTDWFTDKSSLRYILNRRSTTSGFEYASGFHCNADTDSCTFSILIVQRYSDGPPQVVWSANRNSTVKTNATLHLTGEGDLVLRDVDGTMAWSTNTAGRSIVGLNLTEMGNLVLFDAKNSVVWQSFDHPTDCLLPGQILVSGMNLTTALSSSNGSLFSVSMTREGLVASILSDPSQVYYQELKASYAKFENGSLVLYLEGDLPEYTGTSLTIHSVQYMKLGDDGHLRVFEWGDPWKEVNDIFTDSIGHCGYPMVCGKYGICSNGQCTCPSGTSFRQMSERHPELGCSSLVPLTCNASVNHTFLDLYNVTYFDLNAHIVETDHKDGCKEICLKNCSCKAAIFSDGECRMPSEIFSLKESAWSSDDQSPVSIKVQIDEVATALTVAKRKPGLLVPILGSSLGVICIAIVVGIAVRVRQSTKKRFGVVEEEYLDHVPGMPNRFSLEELAASTDNFNKKLGEGGFGSVYEGSLKDGTRIAVKRLDGVGHIKKSFLAEVETIGSIHHINLVRLIGFCAEKSHRLLVYEYMCNGSLDRWIYCRSHETTTLDWNQRRKIILDIAKGLTYLHEDCRQKIIHLDIKPQNILLDQHYNAKLADFGLSKLVDRDQSRVVTTMRGTPGYLAPEWLSAEITEKVDVYSFGIVILEIVCGRKIFEQWRAEGERYLLTVFKRKAMEEQWLDLVDKCCLDVESNVAQVEEMLRISAWCIQGDHDKRPSMSVVIKVLEGVMDVQTDIDYNFMVPQYLSSRTPEVSAQDTTTLLPSLLSGPSDSSKYGLPSPLHGGGSVLLPRRSSRSSSSSMADLCHNRSCSTLMAPRCLNDAQKKRRCWSTTGRAVLLFSRFKLMSL